MAITSHNVHYEKKFMSIWGIEKIYRKQKRMRSIPIQKKDKNDFLQAVSLCSFFMFDISFDAFNVPPNSVLKPYAQHDAITNNCKFH